MSKTNNKTAEAVDNFLRQELPHSLVGNEWRVLLKNFYIQARTRQLEEVEREIERQTKDTENIEVPQGANIGEYRHTESLKRTGYNQALLDLSTFINKLKK
jgi:hypothetical protein